MTDLTSAESSDDLQLELAANLSQRSVTQADDFLRDLGGVAPRAVEEVVNG